MEPFEFTNDADGFQLLHSKLEALSLQDDSLLIGLESTTHYGDNLVDTLLPVTSMCVLNSIKTSSMRKNNIRKTKTDKVDTLIIAKTLMMQESLRFVTFYDLDLMDLKQLGRFRQKTIKQRTRLIIQLVSILLKMSKCLNKFEPTNHDLEEHCSIQPNTIFFQVYHVYIYNSIAYTN